MANRYVGFHSEGEGRALVELARGYNPKNAVREFVTNSLDARVKDKRVNISLIVDPFDRRVIISDNGCGMTNEELYARALSIGYSEKRGVTDQRGEKALGLLAFGSLG